MRERSEVMTKEEVDCHAWLQARNDGERANL